MTWQDDLKKHAENLRMKAKYNKKDSKFDDVVGYKGKKGFSDTGVPLTGRAAKQLQRNKTSYRKNSYYGSRLNIINDTRKEDARKRRMESPEHKARVDKIIEIADRELDSEKEKRRQQDRINRSYGRMDRIGVSNNSSFNITGKPYSDPFSTNPDPGSVEIDLDRISSRSTLQNEPRFNSKVDEAIYRIKKENLKK